MERLTIKELAAYATHGLRIKLPNGKIKKLKSIDFELSILNFGWKDTVYLKDETVLPLLRPISQLTEEIEHNGERFVPIIELAKMFHIPGKYAVTHYGDIKDYGYVGIKVNCYVENSNSRYSEFSIHSDELILHNDYRIVQKLHEWHFDTANLLGRNLALPIDGKEVKP